MMMGVQNNALVEGANFKVRQSMNLVFFVGDYFKKINGNLQEISLF